MMRKLIWCVLALLLPAGVSAQGFIQYYPPTPSKSASGWTFNAPVLLQNGTQNCFDGGPTALGMQFADETGTGLLKCAGNRINLTVGNTFVADFYASRVDFRKPVSLSNDGDTIITRDAAGVSVQRNGDNPQANRLSGGFSSYLERGSAVEAITLSTVGTTTDSSANLLPASSYIEAVVVRVTTGVTGAGVTSLSIGDPTTAGRFCTLVGLTINTTASCILHVDQTGAPGPKQASAAKVRITAVGGTPSAGAVRVIVYYRLATVPAT